MEKLDDIEKIGEDSDIAEIRNAVKELNRGKEPQSLKFYSGGVEGAELMAFARRRLGFLRLENENFTKYLTSLPYSLQILTKNNKNSHQGWYILC